jgi:ankyrin repeat protein
MISGVIKSITAGIFFANYFDFVERYDFYKKFQDRAIISPVAYVNEFDLRGMQPIHLAVERGSFGATFALVDRFGANINERTLPVEPGKGPNGIPPYSTPLIIAIIQNNLEIFHYLLSKRDLDKNLGTDQFKSPLHFAAEVGNLEMVEALMETGAKISYLKKTRKTAFHLALASCNVQVAEWLAERKFGIGPVCNPTQMESIFHFLARQKLPTDIWIKMLIVCEKATGSLERKPSAQGARFIDLPAINGMTPLQVAIEEENDSAIAGLIVCGADISQTTDAFVEVGTPLIKAVHEFFSDTPISPNFINDENETIWHLCARYDAVHLIQGVVYLFPEKTNLREHSSNGLTALELAFEMQNLNVALELIKLHDHFIQIDVLERLASRAAWNCWPELLESLIQEFPSDFALIMSPSSPSSLRLLHIIVTLPVRQSSKINPKNVVLLLIKNYPHLIQSRDKLLGRTPLHLAFECEYMEFFDWLVEAKLSNPELDFNVYDNEGRSFSNLLKEKNEISLLNLLNLN